MPRLSIRYNQTISRLELSVAGIYTDMVNLVMDFQTERHQELKPFTVNGEIFSEPCDVANAAPLGTVLDPTIFLAYIKGIMNKTKLTTLEIV